jgi:hypothetical protein
LTSKSRSRIIQTERTEQPGLFHGITVTGKKKITAHNRSEMNSRLAVVESGVRNGIKLATTPMFKS